MDASDDAARPAYTDVDQDDAEFLISVMAATDGWPAVVASRHWALDQVGAGEGVVIVDVGCGPGTFGSLARRRGATTVDIDRSHEMLRWLSTHASTRVARADGDRLPLRTASADVVHFERVLQWVPDPGATLVEAQRVLRPGGYLIVSDTDWRTFVVDHPDASVAATIDAAAGAWVPHPTVARSIARRCRGAGATSVEVRADAVPIVAWDPDAESQADGPPGLPLRTMASVVAGGDSTIDRAALAAAIEGVAALAREGSFYASLTLVTTVARF